MTDIDYQSLSWFFNGLILGYVINQHFKIQEDIKLIDACQKTLDLIQEIKDERTKDLENKIRQAMAERDNRK